MYKVNISANRAFSKGVVLFQIVLMYKHLVFLGLKIANAKKFMQQLWLLNVE